MTFDEKDKFFLKYGKRIYYPKETQKGDILGIIDEKNSYVSLNYVEEVHLNPMFVKGDYFPSVRLKQPYFGFSISEEAKITGYKFLSIDQRNIVRLWTPDVITEDFDEEKQAKQREFLESDFFKREERVYIVNKKPFKELGEMIPLFEIPSMSFLPQSLSLDDLVKKLYEAKDIVKNLRGDSEKLKKLWKDI